MQESKSRSTIRSAPAANESRIFELVKQKDKALAEYAARMEQKARELEFLVRELNQRNEELSNGLAVLRLYQAMFENEPAGIVGADREGRIIQFNTSAVRFFGVGLHALRLQHVSSLTLQGVGGEPPSLGELFAKTLASGEEGSLLVKAQSGRLRVSCHRLEDISGLRGVVFRVISLDEK